MYDGCSDYSFQVGTVLCTCGPPNDLSLQLVKNWIKDKRLTNEDVSLKRNSECYFVEAKTEVFLD